MARYPYREIVEMRSTGLTEAKVAHVCGVTRVKVGSVVRAAERLGICWPVPPELGDDELERLLDPVEHFRKFQPDFPAIRETLGVRKLKRKHLKRAYAAYLEMAEAADGDPYTESTFAVHLGEWAAVAHPDVTMRVNWHLGEEAQLDWAGRTLELVSADGMRAPAYLFVATLPYSDYTFVRASLSMGMQSWLEHNVAMLEFFGGVPIFAAIDNLATGVTILADGTKRVNLKYRDLADHYGFIVVPARPNTPTDKGSVERHVRFMANSIVGILEGMRFTSIDQLNAAIAEVLEIFNDRPCSAIGGISRREAFERWEKAALQPLPAEPFVPVTWRKMRVAFDGVVRVRGNYYQVPGEFADSKVRVRISDTRVDVYDFRRSQCLASHPRREDGAETFEGLPGTCPDRFRPLDDWAHANGREAILDQWDGERNAGLSPSVIVCRSKKEVWWLCPDCGFRWREAVVRRTSRDFDDCLACGSIALVPGVNDLATTHPEIAVEWDDERNPMPADSVFADWHQRMWWRGRCGHSWCAPVAERTRSAEGALCPYCSGKKALPGFNDVATLAPGMAAQWHPSKNRNVRPETLSVCAAHEAYLWDGPLSRIWRETPRAWLKRHGMPEVVRPFEREVELARMADAAHPPAPTHTEEIGRAKATVKWKFFVRQAGLDMSLREWCEAFCHMELVEQWDAERNGGLTPDDVSRCDRRRVWWTDRECGHSWRETVRNRTFRDNGCIYCARRRVLAGYSSVECLEARLLKMWHPTANLPLTPDMVSDRSHTPVWWQCPECGYAWQESPRRTNAPSRKCPACEKRPKYVVPGRNDLAGVRPDLAAMVDPVLNEGVDVAGVASGARRALWWRGECGHVWLARVDGMIHLKDPEACPYCSGRRLLRGFNDITVVSPEAAEMWHPTRNAPVEPWDVKANSSQAYWWRGECGHEWKMEASRMTSGGGCPYCRGRQVMAGENDLATLYPEIAAQWHPTLNGDLRPSQLRAHSNRDVWWTCERGHEWRVSVNNRTRHDAGCPVCAGRKAVAGVNDLATTHRKLARQWHPERNGGLRASDVTSISSKSVWWRCRHGHEWRAKVSKRAGDHDPGCPYCAGRRAWPGFNDLATLRPDLAAEWHPHMNKGLMPADVVPGSAKEVWWRGKCGHVFQLKVCVRSKAKEASCPYCSGKKAPERPIEGLR